MIWAVAVPPAGTVTEPVTTVVTGMVRGWPVEAPEGRT
jgi:hypothetical protein